MSTATPARISIPQNKGKGIKDESCFMMCPDCNVRGTATGQEDDETTWVCPMCGVNFGVEWGW